MIKYFSKVLVAVVGLCVLCLGIQNLEGATLHAILIGDYYSADIREASRMDIQNVTNELAQIANFSGFDLKATIFPGDQIVAQKVQRALKKLSVKKSDVIFFYFTGHGYRTLEPEADPWPCIDFALEERGMSFKVILETIKAKKARLSIVLADCCNWQMSQVGAPPLLLEKKAAVSRLIKKNYQRLFSRTKGVIAIASCKAGQASYCVPYGSFYTIAFLKSLHSVVNESTADWSKLFAGAQQYLDEMLNEHNLQQDPAIFMSIN